jgi:hypothetical protein
MHISAQLALTRRAGNWFNPRSQAKLPRQLRCDRAAGGPPVRPAATRIPCLGAQGETGLTTRKPGTRNRGATDMATKKTKSKIIKKSAKRSTKAKKSTAAKRSPKKR